MNCIDILEFFSIASALDQTSSADTFRNCYDHNLGYAHMHSTEESNLSFGFDIRSFSQGLKTKIKTEILKNQNKIFPANRPVLNQVRKQR